MDKLFPCHELNLLPIIGATHLKIFLKTKTFRFQALLLGRDKGNTSQQIFMYACYDYFQHCLTVFHLRVGQPKLFGNFSLVSDTVSISSLVILETAARNLPLLSLILTFSLFWGDICLFSSFLKTNIGIILQPASWVNLGTWRHL